MSTSTSVNPDALGQSLPWQKSQWLHLQTLKTAGKLPHALLLRGPMGTGKLHFSTAFAKSLLCASPEDGWACDECKFCKLFVAGTHPDFCAVQPEEGSRTIKVEQIRDVIGFASRKAQFEGFRVVLLHPAEAMNVNASNALLKCLEEPGANTVIVLVTHQISQLLPTIRSRCQSIEFPIPPEDAVLPWLETRVQGAQKAQRLLKLAGGCPVKACALASGEWQKQREQTFEHWWALVQQRSTLVEAAEALAKFPLVDVLEWLAGWYVDLARLKLNPQANVLDEERRQVFQQYTRALPADRLFSQYDQVMELRAAFMRGANFNPQMALEGLFGVLRS